MDVRFDFSMQDQHAPVQAELGAVYSREKTVFRVWSPPAQEVTLNLYGSGSGGTAESTAAMQREQSGIWSVEIAGDLNGKYYTYTLVIDGVQRETIDIYARSAGVNGERGMVIDMRCAAPEGWERSQTVSLDSPVDAVIYELHVRDFSADESAGFTHRGKFLAFTEKGVTNSFGDTVGLEYIRSLGVTHIHLLPVFDFASVDESSCEPQYNWGYDPLNYNIPEGSYSTDPTDGFCRVREFRELIAAVHEMGMGVIMDVVYNHTYRSEDSSFNKIYPDYYYRHEGDRLSNGSGCGNEFASERRMASKFICDSLCFLAREYKLDGFRFDLMGLLDIETLTHCREELLKINPSILLYGEGWTGGASPLPEEKRAMKHNAAKLPGFAFFSDDFRDAVKGSVFEDEGRGFVSGVCDENMQHRIASMMAGGVRHWKCIRPHGELWTNDPAQTVNYVEAHDNLTLHDKLKCSLLPSGQPTFRERPALSQHELNAADKLAAAIVMFSQGIPFIQAGQEFLRSKPSPEGGYVHDSYNSPDSVNSLKWDDVTTNREIVEYYRGLIALRKKFPQFRMRTAEEICHNIVFRYHPSGAIAMHIGKLALIVNPREIPVRLTLSSGYEVYADGCKASDVPFACGKVTAEAAPHSVLLTLWGRDRS